MNINFGFIICFLFFIFLDEVNLQITNVKLLFVNEDTNLIAKESVEVALQYIKKNPNLKLQVDLQTTVGKKNDSQTFLQSLCEKYTEMVLKNAPPHIVVDTTIFGLTSETVKYFTKSLKLPTVSGSFGQEGDLRHWRNISEDEEKYLIHIRPPADVVTDIVKAFVMTLKMPNLVILYDNQFVMDHKLKTLLLNFSTRHIILPVNFTDVVNQLKRVKNVDIVNFFVFGDITTIQLVLDAAEKLNFLSKKEAWHVITLNNGELKCNCSNTPILFAQPELITSSRLEILKNAYNFSIEPLIISAFYFDLTLFSVLAVRDMINENVWLENRNILTCENVTYSAPNRNLEFSKYLKSVSEPPTFGPFNIPSNGKSLMEFKMDLSAVSIHRNIVQDINNLGQWKYGEDNNFTFSDPFIAMDQYVNTKYYKVVVMEQKPFIYVDNSTKRFRGYCIDLMEMISKYGKFKYDMYLVEDRRFGELNKKGEWNGMVRALLDGKADIALGSFSVTLEREQVIDFTIPFYEGVGITVLMKRHLPSDSLFKFLSVLDIDVWLCILAAYIFTSFTIWIFDKYSPYSYQNSKSKYEKSDEKRLFTFLECLWFCITSLTPQGGGEAPKNLSGRLIAATWWLFAFIIISSYTANLAAFLTVTRQESSIASLNDLSQQYQISYAPVQDTMTMQYFERMANIEQTFYDIWENIFLNNSLSHVERNKLSVWEYPISDKYSKMWYSMQQTGLPQTPEEAIQRVRDSKFETDGFAYIGDGVDLKYLALVYCDLQVIGDEFSKKPLAIGVRKNSALKTIISNAIMDLMVKRKLEYLKQKWWTENTEIHICNEESILYSGISIHNIAGVFIIIAVGISFACIASIIKSRAIRH